MSDDLIFHLRSLTRLIYVVAEEEDRFLIELGKKLKDRLAARTKVFNAAQGLLPLNEAIRDWTSHQNVQGDPVGAMEIHAALTSIYTDDPKDEQNYYVFTDPERWLGDAHIQRRILNIVHQLHQDIRTIKVLIFVGPRKAIPEKLAPYMEVVHDKGLDKEEVEKIVEVAVGHLKLPMPENAFEMFKGLTDWQVNAAIAQSVARMKELKIAKEDRKLEPKVIAEFRRNQLHKTDLVQHIDTSQYTFDQVGGLNRFKGWARRSRAVWSDKGREFGLEPPKGVLCVGVWGAGKSLSVKALGETWGLPVVQLEMGKLRDSGVGNTEANTYRAIRIIESAAPCLVWIDEAEKSLSGGQSSAQSDAGTTNRMIGIFSTWLQETTARVCVAMTANTLSTLPVEFVNRMDERWYFGPPELDDRIEVLKIHLAKRGQDPSGYNLARLGESSSGLVGREIEQAIKAAFVTSFYEEKDSLDEDILNAELTQKPRIIKTMQDEIAEVTEWVGYDEDVDDGIRARYASDPNMKRGGSGPKVVAPG